MCPKYVLANNNINILLVSEGGGVGRQYHLDEYPHTCSANLIKLDMYDVEVSLGAI